MYRGTTPEIHINVSGSTPSEWTEMYLTFKQGDNIITKDLTDVEVEGTLLKFSFTQAETLLFDANKSIKIQIRYKKGEYAGASDMKEVSVRDILKEGVI